MTRRSFLAAVFGASVAKPVMPNPIETQLDRLIAESHRLTAKYFREKWVIVPTAANTFQGVEITSVFFDEVRLWDEVDWTTLS